MDTIAVEDVIAFVVFFFPGFVSLNIACILCGSDIKKKTELEIIIWSSIFSILSFSSAGVTISPERIARAVFTSQTIIGVFIMSLVIGSATGLLAIGWLHFSGFYEKMAQKIRQTLNIPYVSYETACSPALLRQLFASREKNQIIVHTSSGEVYKGYLAGYGSEPLELILTRSKDTPISIKKVDLWEPIEEYLMFFSKEDIRKISVISK